MEEFRRTESGQITFGLLWKTFRILQKRRKTNYTERRCNYLIENFPPLDDEEHLQQPKDSPEFVIMISVVTSALREDGTEVLNRDRGIRVCPLVKLVGNTYKCSAQPTQKTSQDFIVSLNDILGPPDNILGADESNVDRKSFISCNFENNLYIIDQQCIDHISHLLNNIHT